MLRGVEARHEQRPQQLLRDTRTIGQRILDFFKDRLNATILYLCALPICFLFSALVDVYFISGIIIFFLTLHYKPTLPFRLPLHSKAPDYNDPKPGSNKPNLANGIAFFGNDRFTNEELWFNNVDLRTHVLIFGSTGSGKTQALISLAYNSLVFGSGFIYVDGKGDNTVFSQIFSMTRSMGREDDLLLINFMTGARDIVGPQEKRLSNTMNPFANGSSSMLSQLVVSLMDSSSSSPDGDMWKGRAISFVESLMKVLVYMRDQGHILLDANSIRNYFHLDRLEAIVIDKTFPRDNDESVSLHDVPEVVLEPIKNYLLNLPGYDKSKKGKQVSQVFEQHGFITMQLTRVFTSLADTYGHIMRTNLAEVDLKDVVLNRRILVVLLPALEKSPAELSNLGKVIIATLKAMMASGLGEQVEGTYRDTIQRKPTNSSTPFICILDEYGYYAVEGFAVVPAQARSLGFSTIFAGQDLPAFQKASKEEAASIGANTNIKICMKLEDPTETWEFFSKSAGEAYVSKVDAFQTRAESIFNQYLDTRSASTEKRVRIDLLDLKDQREGEAHILFKSHIIRAKMFYANPPQVKEMRLNHFLKVDKPPSILLRSLERQFQQFKEIIDNESYKNFNIESSAEDITVIAEALHAHSELEPIERGIAALVSLYQPPLEKAEYAEEALPDDELNLFTPMRESDYINTHLLVRDRTEFAQPILDKAFSYEYIHSIETLLGKTERHASSIANEIINDMRVGTFYPPEISTQLDCDELLSLGTELIEAIQSIRSEASETSSYDD